MGHSGLVQNGIRQYHATQIMVFLGAKSTSILDCIGLSVGRSVGPPRCAITWKNRVTSRLLREEEEEEETDYVAIPLRRDSFAPRD
jgi:hypothetical protein